ncbi:hypothetical protein F4859DRAFT_76611 [Xylaria cf. heliscus]|nr:hypothetical protein F4859DRAFT_76611 [Xylaria cf. heliscus]
MEIYRSRGMSRRCTDRDCLIGIIVLSCCIRRAQLSDSRSEPNRQTAAPPHQSADISGTSVPDDVHWVPSHTSDGRFPLNGHAVACMLQGTILAYNATLMDLLMSSSSFYLLPRYTKSRNHGNRTTRRLAKLLERACVLPIYTRRTGERRVNNSTTCHGTP